VKRVICQLSRHYGAKVVMQHAYWLRQVGLQMTLLACGLNGRHYFKLNMSRSRIASRLKIVPKYSEIHLPQHVEATREKTFLLRSSSSRIFSHVLHPCTPVSHFRVFSFSASPSVQIAYLLKLLGLLCCCMQRSITRIVWFVDRLTGRTLGNRYGPGTGRIWLDNLACTGSETYIGNCSHNGWGSHNCGHYEDVSIACYRDLANGQ